MAEEPITLEFLSRQMDQLLDRFGTVEDQMSVQTGMIIRLDGSVQGLTTEVRALHRLFDRLERRVRKLEDHTPTITPPGE